MTALPERLPTRDECLDEGAPLLADLFDEVYGVGRWRAPDPEQAADTDRVAS